MAKFLTLWEVDTTRIPDNPEEQIRYHTMLLNMVKDSLKSDETMDWGEFAGGGRGYTISEGTEQELYMSLSRYVPYVKFEVHPILSINQIEEMMKAGSQA
ncbi:MAG: hypothetical protein U9N43_03300 [Euryarchaeota archaeon]|nr:hypothetical protein [Euryarchaeota archaeon]